MKRIGIVTLYHKNYNYGGQLQAFAMQKVFSGEELESKLVTFENNSKKYFFKRVKDLGFKKTLRSVINKVRFKCLLRKESFKVDYTKKIYRYNEFINSIPHTKLYTDKTINESNNEFDMFVCGSDQIWNPGWWNDILLLTFTNKRKFAYAASIARGSLKEEEIKYLKENTKGYKAVSVREVQAQELLENALQRPIEFVLDPTLLVDKDEWEKITNSPEKKEDYAFVYMVGNSKGLKEHIYKECKKIGCKVISIGYAKNTYFSSEEKYSDIIIKDAGPREWLGWMQNAKYVFTDSFHGSVFSIIFERQFWCFERDNPNDKQNENSRLYSFLKITGLENRLLNSDKSIFVDNDETIINYDCVKSSLQPYRDQSFEYINKHIK